MGLAKITSTNQKSTALLLALCLIAVGLVIFLIIVIINYSVKMIIATYQTVPHIALDNITNQIMYPQNDKGTLTPMQEYVKAAIGGVGTLFGAFIGGLISFFVFWRGLKASTRNAFLDMIMEQDSYKNELQEFIQGLNDPNATRVRRYYREGYAIFYLLLRKPGLKKKFDSAMETGDMCRIRQLSQELFSE